MTLAHDANAICEPSGDHAGSLSSTAPTFVRSTGSLPSAFITQMSREPPPYPVNAIFVPSATTPATPRLSPGSR